MQSLKRYNVLKLTYLNPVNFSRRINTIIKKLHTGLVQLHNYFNFLTGCNLFRNSSTRIVNFENSAKSSIIRQIYALGDNTLTNCVNFC